MTKVNRLLAMAGVAAMMCVGSNSLMAQAPGGGRGFNRAQFQQRMNQMMRDRLQITSDDDWNAIQPLIQKVMQAQREARMGGGMRMFGPRMAGRRGRGGAGGPGAQNGNNQRTRRFRGPQPSPAAQALQQAIDNNAGNEAIKAALDKYVASRKEKEKALKTAQDDLRKVVTPRQEAILTLMGML